MAVSNSKYNFATVSEYNSIIDPVNLAINGSFKINQRNTYNPEIQTDAERELILDSYIADCWRVTRIDNGITDLVCANDQRGGIDIQGRLTVDSPQRIVFENELGGLFGPKGSIPQMDLTNYVYFLNYPETSISIDVSTYTEPVYSPPISSSGMTPVQYTSLVDAYYNAFYDPIDGPGFKYNRAKTRYIPGYAKLTKFSALPAGQVGWTDERTVEVTLNPLSQDIDNNVQNFKFSFARFTQLRGSFSEQIQLRKTPFTDDFVRCKSFFQSGKIDLYVSGVTDGDDMYYSTYIQIPIPMELIPLIKIEIEEIFEQHSDVNVKTNYALYDKTNPNFHIPNDASSGDPLEPVEILVYDKNGYVGGSISSAVLDGDYDRNGFLFKVMKIDGEKGNLLSRIKGRWTVEVVGDA